MMSPLKFFALTFIIGILIGAAIPTAYFIIEDYKTNETDLTVTEYTLTETGSETWHIYVLTFEAPTSGTLSLTDGDNVLTVYFIDKGFDISHDYSKGMNRIEFASRENITEVRFTNDA